MKNRIWTSLWAVLLTLGVYGQMQEPAHFTSQLKMLGGDEAEIVFRATIDEGWHVYATDLGSDGPISATFHSVKMEGVETVGKLRTRGSVTKQFDRIFGMELRYFEHQATFVQKVRFTRPQYAIDCYLEYGACNDMMCLPPSQVEFKKTGRVTLTDTSSLPSASVDSPAMADSTVAATSDGLWAPVIDELRSEGGADNLTDRSLFYILLMGFIGGLLAVLMPCIWPIIPMTVSFFLKRGRDKGRGLRDALIYGASIVVIYLTLGLLVTALFGSDTLNALSTNAVFNVLLFLLLVVFALSFFGWFEIHLPDSWATKVDAKADTLASHQSSLTSYLSIFLMAFTLVLVSFSCTAPIIGLLLVETATSGN